MLDNNLKMPEIILFCAFRYAIGRESYITSVVADEITKHKGSLSKHFKSLVIKEIERADKEDRLGMENIDKPEWLKLKDLLIK